MPPAGSAARADATAALCRSPDVAQMPFTCSNHVAAADLPPESLVVAVDSMVDGLDVSSEVGGSGADQEGVAGVGDGKGPGDDCEEHPQRAAAVRITNLMTCDIGLVTGAPIP